MVAFDLLSMLSSPLPSRIRLQKSSLTGCRGAHRCLNRPILRTVALYGTAARTHCLDWTSASRVAASPGTVVRVLQARADLASGLNAPQADGPSALEAATFFRTANERSSFAN